MSWDDRKLIHSNGAFSASPGALSAPLGDLSVSLTTIAPGGHPTAGALPLLFTTAADTRLHLR
jgi:hypothetical protein